MKTKHKNKKADIFQLVVLLIILFIAAVVGLLFNTMSNKVTQIYEDTGLLNGTAIGQQYNDMMQDTGPKSTDYMIFMLFCGGVIGLMISASKTSFSPTVFFLFLMLLIITIFVASGLVNIYSGFAQQDMLVDSANQLVLTGFIFSKYTPLIFTVVGGIIMLLMWSRTGNDIIV
jgi:hypothetical protein